MSGIEDARRLTLAFLRCTRCEAVALDLDGFACVRVQSGAEAVLFRFVADQSGSVPVPVARDAGVFAVMFFADVHLILQRLGWISTVLE